MKVVRSPLIEFCTWWKRPAGALTAFVEKSHLNRVGLGIVWLASLTLPVVNFAQATARAPAVAKAFPTAEGFGTETRGAYGGSHNPTVYKVTTLNDPAKRTPTFDGSFRWAIEAPEPRIILFEVSGYITVANDWIRVNNPYLTIAGQTAPGDGICLRSAPSLGKTPFLITTHDVIVRHLRVRPGRKSPGISVSSLQAIQLGHASGGKETYNVVLDHCSATWGIDGDMQLSDLTHDITIQWCLISEGLNDAGHGDGFHSRALNFYVGSAASNHEVNGRATVHHNLMSNVEYRVPQISTTVGAVEVINNVVYHTTVAGMNINAGAHNSVSNSRTRFINNYLLRTNPVHGDVRISNPAHRPTVLVHASGNIGPARPDDKLPDNRTLGDTVTTCAVCRSTTPPTQKNHWTPESRCADQTGSFPFPAIMVRPDSAAVALARISGTGSCAGQQNVGATRPRRDAVDTRILNNLVAYIANPAAANTVPVPGGPRGGLLDDPAQVGGYPALAAGTPPADSDGDGMADDWEIAHKLDPRSAADGPLVAANSYRNLENYLNELAGDPVNLTP